MRHYLYCFIVIIVTSLSPIIAKEIPDVLWISADGVSRNTFYALLHKKQLPNIQKLMSHGNYRNLDVLTPDPQLGYVHILTGMNSTATVDDKTHKIKKNLTVFEKVKEKHNSVTVKILLSEIEGPQTPESLLNKNELESTGITMLTSTSDSQIFAEAKQAMNSKTPLFLFIQDTDMAKSVLRYREGTEHYSDTIIAFDRHVGDLIAHYNLTKRDRPLFVIINSSYGFEKNSKKPSPEAWVLSNIKISRKAFSVDIVPSILQLYMIPAKRPTYVGNRFF